LANCSFTTRYWNYESQAVNDYYCEEDSRGNSGKCIFHDEDYLHDMGSSLEERKNNVRTKVMDKVRKSIVDKESLFLIGYYLPDVTIGGSFTKRAYFNQCRFQGRADFSLAEFSKAADFSSTKFFEIADFSFTEFSGKANFVTARFSEADFDSARFSEADFDSARFSEADFASAEFSGEADFANAEFYISSRFGSAKFYEAAYFVIAKFFGEEDFANTEFYKAADFFSAEFYIVADFESAKFSGEADFSSAEFHDKANFTFAKFLGRASFPTKFPGTAIFSSAEFHEKANFHSIEFSEAADFSSAKFSGAADFTEAKFSEVSFRSAEFSGAADFSGISIKDKANFNYVLFEDGKKILFGIDDLSRVSFMNSDITRVRFSDRARWGKGQDNFKVFDEETLEKELLEKKTPTVSLNSVMAVYRNLRENYEFRLRYDEAGEFFKKEMELKRKYREEDRVYQNGWFRRHFSLTGLYKHFSDYGESIKKPAIIGAIIVSLSTAFWMIQNNPSAELSFSFFASSNPLSTKTVSNFINASQILNNTHTSLSLSFIAIHKSLITKTASNFINASQILNNTHTLKAFERSLGDFLPTLFSASDIKVSVIDYVVKLVGGALTFVLLAVALRRKFERKYTR